MLSQRFSGSGAKFGFGRGAIHFLKNRILSSKQIVFLTEISKKEICLVIELSAAKRQQKARDH